MNPKKIVNRIQIGIAAVLLLLLGAYALDGFITDIIWFRKEGYLPVFLTEITTKLKLGIPAFIVITLLAKMLLGFLRSNFTKKSGLAAQSEKAQKRLTRVSWLLSAGFGALLAVSVVGPMWFKILQFMNSTEFSIADPLFSKDISFYIFRLDFLRNLSACAINFAVSLAVMLGIFYAFLIGSTQKQEPVNVFSSAEEAQKAAEEEAQQNSEENPFRGAFGAGRKTVTIDNEELKAKGKALLTVASGQIILLGILFFLGIAVSIYLKQFDLLYGGTGVAYGAGYTDITVTLNIYRVMMALALLSAVMLVIAVRKRSLKLALIFPALMIVTSMAGTFLAAGVQSLVVAPDELNKESKFLKNNIEYTRLAYNLQDIQVRDFTADGKLSNVDVLENMETFSNIRINDFDPANQFYNQTQSIRSYYTFNDVDVDRYNINGEYTQCFLSAREIDQSKIEDSWLIRHLKYTHGYGITLSRVDKVTASGQPDMLVQSIPPVSQVAEIQVERPEIYYGESTGTYVITNTGEKEFDYPSGESNVYCSYEGDGGIQLTPLNRILFAIREQNLKLLISTNIKSDSRIHIYRNIKERAAKIAPFLTYNDDPYIVCEDGKLYWIIDAYTTSNLYPYSEPYSESVSTNYIRNSVKVVIDAYNGNINYYICDEQDPLAATLAKIYPSLFKSLDQMPQSLRGHLQYPNNLFNIQAYVYTKYHMTDEAVFYQSEDQWSIASEQYGQKTQQMEPHYFIMKLPGETKAEFVSTIPYTPNGKANLTGILTSRQDGENYGQLVLYRMPKDKTVYGPSQIEAQINQDAEISKEFSLWNNSGSSYLRGNMFVIPVNNSLLYVEPIYLEASTGSLPEVKRVVAYFGDQVAYEDTLADCLNALFGPSTGDPLAADNPIETGLQMAEEIKHPPVKPQEPEKPQDKPQELPTHPGNIQVPEADPEFTDENGELLVDGDLKDLAVMAQAAYEKALEAMQQGNWIDYGKYMDLLSRYLELMAAPALTE